MTVDSVAAFDAFCAPFHVGEAARRPFREMEEAVRAALCRLVLAGDRPTQVILGQQQLAQCRVYVEVGRRLFPALYRSLPAACDGQLSHFAPAGLGIEVPVEYVGEPSAIRIVTEQHPEGMVIPTMC